MLAVLCLVSLILVASVFATTGVDVSQPTSQSSFSCMRGKGIDFAVVRGYMSNGEVDPNVVNTVHNARAAGIPYVDVYMFPCPTCGNCAGQAADAVNHLKANNVDYGMFWLDIEGPQYWMSQAENRECFNGLVAGARGAGAKVAVYSSESQWIPIFGDWNGGADAGLQLWYAHYDGSASFGDFSPFAGWTHPNIKQYQGTTDLCGAGVDMDWYP